jgi:hypothetical protein
MRPTLARAGSVAALTLALAAAACGPTTAFVDPIDGGQQDVSVNNQQDRWVWNPDAGGRPPPCDPDDPNHQPSPETCNGADDDCNGIVDDNVPPRANPESPCQIQVCSYGTWVDAPPEFAEEICNGCDDNNDGCVDGSFINGVCTPLSRQDPNNTGGGCPVIQKCTGGQWVNEGQGTATDEVCNCIDDDCDGIVDNIGLTPCMVTCGGVPNIGTWQCQNCTKVCKPNGIINIEVCDNKDNDCDGQTDEGINPQPCPCGSGQQTCSNGSWVGACDQCTPGTWRWCDDPQKCHWGKQNCVTDPDGNTYWDTCVEVTDRPTGCEGQLMYDANCCDRAGECCQDAFHTWQSCGHCETQCAGSTYTPCT